MLSFPKNIDSFLLRLFVGLRLPLERAKRNWNGRRPMERPQGNWNGLWAPGTREAHLERPPGYWNGLTGLRAP